MCRNVFFKCGTTEYFFLTNVLGAESEEEQEEQGQRGEEEREREKEKEEEEKESAEDEDEKKPVRKKPNIKKTGFVAHRAPMYRA